MIAGATYTLPIDIQYPLGNVSKVIVTLKNETTQQKILKNYPNDNETYLMSDGRLGVRLSQQDTISLVGNVKVEAQINLASGAVAKTETKRVFVSPTLHTEMVEGATDNGEVYLEDVVLEIDAPITENANGGGGGFSVDKTMTVEGAAADAKAVGDLFAAQQKQIDSKQPVGDYALKNEIPVQSVNGKTGAVQLGAADVGAASVEKVAELSEAIDELKENGGDSALDTFIANTDIAHLYDDTTGAYYTVIRVYKQKIDGTYQYPFVYAPNGANAGNKSTLDMTKSDGWLLAINGGVFDTSTLKPDGIVIQNGVSIHNAPTATHSACKPLTINENGILGYASADADTADLIADGIVSAVCGFMPIIIDYESVPENEWNSVSHYTQNTQRQIIGQWGNGDYAIITCEGRGFHNSDGWTIAEAQAICRKHGLKFAYNLDGGGSTETMLGLKPVNTIYENITGRKVPTFIVFNGTDSFSQLPDEPEKTLTSISAVYSGGSVPIGTPVTGLADIVVTAIYSDGTSEIVTDYTLTGTIAEGNNTVTVSYNDKTTTFAVTGYEVDPTASVLLRWMWVIYDESWGHVAFENIKKARICAVSEQNTPKFPAASNTTLTGELSNYAPIKLPDGAKSITIVCPGLNAAVGLMATDGTNWMRIVDSGWLKEGGATYTLPLDAEYTHYYVNFKKVDYTDIEPDFDISGISIVVDVDEPKPESQLGNMYRLPAETVFSGDDYIDTGVKLVETDRDFTIAFYVTPGTQSSSISQIFNSEKEITGYPGFAFSCHNGSEYYRLAVAYGSNGTKIPKTTTEPFKVVITHKKDTSYFVMSYLYNGVVESGNGDNVAQSNFITDVNFIIGAWQDTSGNKGRHWVGTMHEFYIDDYVWGNDLIKEYLK